MFIFKPILQNKNQFFCCFGTFWVLQQKNWKVQLIVMKRLILTPFMILQLCDFLILTLILRSNVWIASPAIPLTKGSNKVLTMGLSVTIIFIPNQKLGNPYTIVSTTIPKQSQLFTQSSNYIGPFGGGRWQGQASTMGTRWMSTSASWSPLLLTSILLIFHLMLLLSSAGVEIAMHFQP